MHHSASMGWYKTFQDYVFVLFACVFWHLQASYINPLWPSDTKENWTDFGSGNSVVPDSTKPIPEPMLTYHQQGSLTWVRAAIPKEIPRPTITKISLKITYLKFHLNLPDLILGLNDPAEQNVMKTWHSPHHRQHNVVVSSQHNDVGSKCGFLYGSTQDQQAAHHRRSIQSRPGASRGRCPYVP